jgi:hypothetical protein
MADSRAKDRARPSLHRKFRESGVLRLILVMTLIVGAKCCAPAGQIPVQDQLNQRPQSPFGDMGNDDPVVVEKRLRALNEERQKNIVSDAAKLLKMAKVLNSEVESSDPASFTPEQMHEISEIEKLAHSVKEKMRFAVGGEPTFREPQIPPIH